MRALISGCALLAAMSIHAASIQLDSGPINQPIPDGNVNGFASTLPGISGEVGWITNVSVTLNISGGYNGDLYAYISHSTGFSVLLNRVGRTTTDAFGYGDEGVQVTFSDAGLTDIHLYGGNGGAPITGTWQPDARNFDPMAVTAATPRSSYLDSFNYLDPNGSWTLYVADLSVGEQSQLLDWQVNIITVPEPTFISLGGLGLGVLAFLHWRRKARQ